MGRKARKGEEVCECAAYRFPHRLFGGKCAFGTWVAGYFDLSKRECRNCMNFDPMEMDCQCCSGVESPIHCPELRDYIRYGGITLYGAALRSFNRAQRKLT